MKKAVLDEINLLYRLRHPHIVQCLGATQHLGHFNIFMEIMPGDCINISNFLLKDLFKLLVYIPFGFIFTIQSKPSISSNQADTIGV